MVGLKRDGTVEQAERFEIAGLFGKIDEPDAVQIQVVGRCAVLGHGGGAADLFAADRGFDIGGGIQRDAVLQLEQVVAGVVITFGPDGVTAGQAGQAGRNPHLVAGTTHLGLQLIGAGGTAKAGFGLTAHGQAGMA